MSLPNNQFNEKDPPEVAFRKAFERLKQGKPQFISKKSFVSQNNVALEAKLHRSALRKNRHPLLIAEIQLFITQNPKPKPVSARQITLAHRATRQESKEITKSLKIQRDKAVSALNDLLKINHYLNMELIELKQSRGEASIYPLKSGTQPTLVEK